MSPHPPHSTSVYDTKEISLVGNLFVLNNNPWYSVPFKYMRTLRAYFQWLTYGVYIYWINFSKRIACMVTQMCWSVPIVLRYKASSWNNSEHEFILVQLRQLPIIGIGKTCHFWHTYLNNKLLLILLLGIIRSNFHPYEVVETAKNFQFKLCVNRGNNNVNQSSRRANNHNIIYIKK